MSYKIVAKYIKNLKFNISKPDIFLTLSKDISNYKFKIDINSTGFKNNIIEIETSLSLVPRENNFEIIEATASFAALVEIDKDLDKRNLEEIILIKVPSNIYPELRKIFIFVFETSGFKEINIDENVDFKKLYLSRKN